jgi:hypothetical protein
MGRWRSGVIMLVAVSLGWTGPPAFAGPGRKVGPPPAPPGQAVESPGEAEGRQVGPVETAPGQAKDKPKQGTQKGHAPPHPPAQRAPTEEPSARGRRDGRP